MFLFRLAFTLKKSVAEILTLPRWEIESWRLLFDVYGPLDWKRDDFRDARQTAYQSIEKKTYGDFLLFGDPSFKERPKTREEREQDVLQQFGYVEE